MTITPDQQKQERAQAAHAAAGLVQPGMTVGLGTGSTVAHLLPVLAARALSIRCVATSPRTEAAALALGLPVEPFGTIDRFDITIDGADQIAPDGWLVKGGGAAHTREKIIAAASDRFVVIVDSAKVVDTIHGPIPIELLAFGLGATRRQLAPLTLRDVPASPDGGIIADYHGDVTDPATTAATLSATAGVIEHGLFPPAMVHDAFVGAPDSVQHLRRTSTGHLEPASTRR
ncbi:MAG TPA: ribose 5-phosphate isomerase A [Nakamurella sp.]